MGPLSLRLLKRATADNLAWLAKCVGAGADELCVRYFGEKQEIAVIYGAGCDFKLIFALAAGSGIQVYRSITVGKREDHYPAALLAGSPAQFKSLAADLISAGVPAGAWLKRGLEDSRPAVWKIGGGRELKLDHTLIMGVLNLTPDSFYAGSRAAAVEEAVRRATEMAEQGAEIIDLGGESTRPGADEVGAEAEIARVAPVVEAVAAELGAVPVSIDTCKARVAAAALDTGAMIVNDVGAGLLDGEMLPTVAARGAGYVMMHMRGRPRTMQQDTAYDDLLGEIHRFFVAGLERCAASGVPDERIVLDPGIGFGKPAAGNYDIISRLGEFATLGQPLLVGASRKSFLTLAGLDRPEDRLEGSLAACAVAVLAGANILRVHDVAGSRRAAAAAEVFVARAGRL